MKNETLQLRAHKQKGLIETTMNNFMPMNCIAWNKWINFLKHTIYQD